MSFATNRSAVNNTVINNSKTQNDNSTNKDNNVDDENATNVDNNQGNGLSAQAGSTGFSIFPHTFLGWLIWVLIILAAIIIIRSVMSNQYHDRGI